MNSEFKIEFIAGTGTEFAFIWVLLLFDTFSMPFIFLKFKVGNNLEFFFHEKLQLYTEGNNLLESIKRF